jgi:tail-anchored protein insertion receptor
MAARFLGTQGLQFVCNAWYAKQPMFWLPQGWVPYHVEWVLSFPRAPIGSISINIWAIACASVIHMTIEAIIGILTLRTGVVQTGERKGEKVKMEPIPAVSSGGDVSEKKEL